MQIKSKSDKHVFDSYIEQYRSMNEFDEMYFVVHTIDNSLTNWKDEPDIKLWDVTKLSNLVVNSGLISWLVKKAT